MHYVLAISAASRRTKDQLADIRLRIPNVGKVRIADIHFFSREGLLAYQESNSSALFALIGLFKQSYNTHLRL